MRKTAPRSHSGWRTRSIAVRQRELAADVRSTTASRCSTALPAFDSADSTAKAIAASIIAGQLALAGAAMGGNGLWLGRELQLPGQPRQRVLEGLRPEVEVVSTRRRHDAGVDPRVGGQSMQRAGRLQALGVLGSGLEPARKAGVVLLGQEIGRIVGVVVGLRATE